MPGASLTSGQRYTFTASGVIEPSDVPFTTSSTLPQFENTSTLVLESRRGVMRLDAMWTIGFSVQFAW